MQRIPAAIRRNFILPIEFESSLDKPKRRYGPAIKHKIAKKISALFDFVADSDRRNKTSEIMQNPKKSKTFFVFGIKQILQTERVSTLLATIYATAGYLHIVEPTAKCLRRGGCFSSPATDYSQSM